MDEFSSDTPDADLARARHGDDAAFTRLVTPLRRELHVHCYRMLASVHDADDALQETLVRAWRGLARFEGRSTLRTWLYTVATRVCLDAVDARSRRALPVDLGPSSEHAVLDQLPRTDIAWLGPYPDAALPGDATGPAGPEARYEQREGVELAFLAACQHLPGNQRAALLLFDVLGYPAAEIAAMMDTSTASVNSALARARRVLASRLPDRTQQQTLRSIGDPAARALAAGFAGALERGDTRALIALLTEDVTWSMPPLPHWYQGVDAVLDFAVQVPITRCPSWRYQVTGANGQAAVAFYLGVDPALPHDAWAVAVLDLREDRIAAITSFLDPGLFPLFGLPATMG
ncbi:sigma-70 family RNA polymerase sigma factor [Streptacidiphilus anmyonensis]|uniref:sigma-70 family RNA polymerase sigma factor n=1 Tax=Streptacidiphilus anmyonensis TaxID=405782 RepID=UPI0005A7D35D|nr:sigma-70 family RNA polymerase sigma factor [Streptacidiphilus anmyonensis]